MTLDKGHKQPFGEKERLAIYERHLAKGHYQAPKTEEQVKNIAKSQQSKWNGGY